jgi:hypothetical protein
MNIDLAANAVERGLFINFLIWKVSIDKSKQRWRRRHNAQHPEKDLHNLG